MFKHLYVTEISICSKDGNIFSIDVLAIFHPSHIDISSIIDLPINAFLDPLKSINI